MPILNKNKIRALIKIIIPDEGSNRTLKLTKLLYPLILCCFFRVENLCGFKVTPTRESADFVLTNRRRISMVIIIGRISVGFTDGLAFITRPINP